LLSLVAQNFLWGKKLSALLFCFPAPAAFVFLQQSQAIFLLSDLRQG
jgi:hypothetical protein